MTDGSLLQDAGNPTQGSGVTSVERKPEREGHVHYIRLTHFAVPQKVTQPCEATISQLKRSNIAYTNTSRDTRMGHTLAHVTQI